MVRHAQPDWEPEDRAVDDPGLTALGQVQASRAADALRGQRFDAVYVSPTRRTLETVAPIAEALAQPTTVQSWLREIEAPALHGQTGAQVASYFERARVRALQEHWHGLPGGESLRHFWERVSSGVEGLLLGDHRLRIHQDGGQRLWQLPEATDRILIVAHEGTNAVILSHLLGIEPAPWGWLRFASRWAGISTIGTVPVAGSHVWALHRFNEAGHLAES